MSETLLAILLVTSSAKGSSLVYRWPPNPQTTPRLSRPKPKTNSSYLQADNPWRASNSSDIPTHEPKNQVNLFEHFPGNDDYVWKRPSARDRSMSYSQSRSRPTSRRASPSPRDDDALDQDDSAVDDDYDSLLGYSAKFLAKMLSPQRSMCHQQFGLVVDDLAFIGHPVCAEQDGTWQFKPEKPKLPPRGRGSRKGQSPHTEEKSLTPERNDRASSPSKSSWLQTFHLVLIHDLPDPSSYSAGNVAKYFDTIYEQVVFTITAVLFQEQVLHNYVEAECDTLGALSDSSEGQSFEEYAVNALKVSSLASAIKALYDSIKEGTIASVTINDIALELQLPPYLDTLLLHVEEDMDTDVVDNLDEDTPNLWGPEMSFAWRLPVLAPWKSLLLLDDEGDQSYQLYNKLRAPQLSGEDRELAEQLIRFMDLASVTLSLADMASLLDWDLESQVYPTVRWLVHHRRAKVVDTVHQGLKTIFTIPPKFNAPLAKLTAEFDETFGKRGVPPLPKILSAVSTATHSQHANHFYATVVGSREYIPLYSDVVVWMLKRELLVTLHLRIRIVATEELKESVRNAWELARARRRRNRRQEGSVDPHDEELNKSDPDNKDTFSLEIASDSSPVGNWFSMSPKSARRHTRQLSEDRGQSRRSLSRFGRDDPEKHDAEEYEDEMEPSDDDSQWEDIYVGEENNDYPSIITEPAQATPLQRRWLAAMSEGKDEHIVRRFERINQYFNGRCTDDEILFKADITRKQLREILHQYEEYVQTFLHPS